MTAGTFRFVVSSSAERIDRLVADATGRGRRTVRRWLLDGKVRVNGHVVTAAARAAVGSEILVESGSEPQQPVAHPLSIMFENADVIVVSKPAGLHSVRGKSAGSVAELLENRLPDLAGVGDLPEEAGLVHRLDRDTSGVMVAARTRQQYMRLRNAFGQQRTRKEYLALASGRLRDSYEISLPLARRSGRMVAAGVHDEALEATTWIEPLDGGDDWSLVLATMQTGVMHQIRAHMAAAGHALLGDRLYGGPSVAGCARDGQLLHALRLEVDGLLDVTVGPPEDFLTAYARLRASGRCDAS